MQVQYRGCTTFLACNFLRPSPDVQFIKAAAQQLFRNSLIIFLLCSCVSLALVPGEICILMMRASTRALLLEYQSKLYLPSFIFLAFYPHPMGLQKICFPRFCFFFTKFFPLVPSFFFHPTNLASSVFFYLIHQLIFFAFSFISGLLNFLSDLEIKTYASSVTL